MYPVSGYFDSCPLYLCNSQSHWLRFSFQRIFLSLLTRIKTTLSFPLSSFYYPLLNTSRENVYYEKKGSIKGPPRLGPLSYTPVSSNNVEECEYRVQLSLNSDRKIPPFGYRSLSPSAWPVTHTGGKDGVGECGPFVLFPTDGVTTSLVTGPFCRTLWPPLSLEPIGLTLSTQV